MLIKHGSIIKSCEHDERRICGRCILREAHQNLGEILEETPTPSEEPSLLLEESLGIIMIEAARYIESYRDPREYHAAALMAAMKNAKNDCTCGQCRNWEKWRRGETLWEPKTWLNPNPQPARTGDLNEPGPRKLRLDYGDPLGRNQDGWPENRA